MNRLASVVLLLLAACSHPYFFTTGAKTVSTPDIAFTCVQAQLDSLGYARLRHDDMERWFVGRKEDPKVHMSSTTFRKAFNILDVRVHPDASGQAAIEIKAQSIHQYNLQRGLTEEEVAASAEVKADAGHLAQACTQ